MISPATAITKYATPETASSPIKERPLTEKNGAAPPQPIDCIYVVASRFDSRFARPCIASIRYFYPDIPIKLVIGSKQIEPELFEELNTYWNVDHSGIRQDDWGVGFVKHELLFRTRPERFLCIDSDIVFAGPVLDALADAEEDFVADRRIVETEATDEERATLPPERIKLLEEVHTLYYDWENVASVDPEARPPHFVFNGGLWLTRTGVFTRKDFETWVNYDSQPPYNMHPEILKFDDQGINNYVVNQKALKGELTFGQRDLMWWPPHGMDAFSIDAIKEGTAPALTLHWAGIKKPSFGAMIGGEVLRFFEAEYYARIPNGERLRIQRRLRSLALGWPAHAHGKLRARISRI